MGRSAAVAGGAGRRLLGASSEPGDVRTDVPATDPTACDGTHSWPGRRCGHRSADRGAIVSLGGSVTMQLNGASIPPGGADRARAERPAGWRRLARDDGPAGPVRLSQPSKRQLPSLRERAGLRAWVLRPAPRQRRVQADRARRGRARRRRDHQAVEVRVDLRTRDRRRGRACGGRQRPHSPRAGVRPEQDVPIVLRGDADGRSGPLPRWHDHPRRVHRRRAADRHHDADIARRRVHGRTEQWQHTGARPAAE